jgi:glycosyltransferase involved in cell wall biosynthesis
MTTSLHVVTSTARRGAETFAVDLVARLEEQSQSATVVALTASDLPRPHPIPALGPSRRSIRTLHELRRRAAEFEVVVAHGSDTLEACAAALAGTGTPFVYRSIGDPAYWVRGRVHRGALAVLHKRAARHVALWGGASKSLESLYGIGQQRIWIIPNAVDERRYSFASDAVRCESRRHLGIPETGLCFGFVGALSDEKDPVAALRIAASVPGATLVVAGDGPLRASLETEAASGPKGRVFFLGSVENLLPVYAAVDALLLPSRTEGMPAALIEAGLVGTPTFATPVGGIPEMIDNGRNGFFLHGQAPWEVAALAEQVTQLRHAGMRASEDFQNRFSMAMVARAWIAALDELCRAS